MESQSLKKKGSTGPVRRAPAVWISGNERSDPEQAATACSFFSVLPGQNNQMVFADAGGQRQQGVVRTDGQALREAGAGLNFAQVRAKALVGGEGWMGKIVYI